MVRAKEIFTILKPKLKPKHFLGLLALFTGLFWLAIFSFPDGRLHLIFCDVGQGDAILITKGFEQILIDGGPNDKVLPCLTNNLPFFDKTIEIVALTHPEADHLTGIIPIMEKYQVDYFFTGPEGNSSAIFAELSSKLKGPADSAGSKLKIINPYTGEKIRLGGVELETMWPEREWIAEKISNFQFPISNSENREAVLGAETEYAKLNDFSLVFLLKYKDFKALLMGDADSKIQDEIMEVNNLIPIDILKFPHHGSKTGILETFLEKIQPKEAVISVGKNSYGHPTNEALDLLKKYGAKIRRTDLEGEVKYIF